MMESPILTRRINEDENVLTFRDRTHTETAECSSYQTLKVQVGRGPDPKPTIYKVVLTTKDARVLDLLVAFEQYLNLNNLKIFYKDYYNREHMVMRDKLMGDFENESSLLLTEEPAAQSSETSA